ncbi:hypothetical protein MYX76_04400 [Desulfobacterota bacterium AH_259_B03_O07]|nr:hypothetical protein [Desulfobacterota bacterium AH_259_B03_O07]
MEIRNIYIFFGYFFHANDILSLNRNDYTKTTMNRKILLILFLILLIVILGTSLFSVYVSIQTKRNLAYYSSEFDKMLLQVRNPTDNLEEGIDINLEAILDIYDSIEELTEEQEKYKTVFIDTSSKGYSRIDTDNGTFLISFVDAKRHLDGLKLVFSIGNPTSATYKGFKLNAVWGKEYIADEWLRKLDKKTQQKDSVVNPRDRIYAYEKWQESLNMKSESYLESLKPGNWNKVELIISPAKEDQLGYLKLSMETDVVSLKGGK